MRPLLNASLLPKALISLNANTWNSSIEVRNCMCDTDDSSEVPQYVGVGVQWVSEAYTLSQRYSESAKTFRRVRRRFGGVKQCLEAFVRIRGVDRRPAHTGRRPKCIEVGSELILCRDPINAQGVLRVAKGRNFQIGSLGFKSDM
jgi:hypothetical protein